MSLKPPLAARIEIWPIGKLVPYDRNARTHTPEQVDQIANSIRKFGFTNPILVDENDALILAGHGRLKAARQLGLEEIPVVPLAHLTEADRRAYILADNKLAENAGWDDEMLRSELESLQTDDYDLTLTGFSARELQNLLDDSADALQGETDPDEAPHVALQPVSRVGDIWLLANHRLYVGDALEGEAVRALMEGDRAQTIITDPPYNVDYVGLTKDELKIQNDSMPPEKFLEFLERAFSQYREFIRLDGSLYVFYPHRWQTLFEKALLKSGFEARCQIIWAKSHFAFGYERYKYQHEPILYCHVQGESDSWYGDQAQSTLWPERKPTANREHPTMKPVELLERALVNSTRRGDVVMDLFGGSGSTLMACERMGRKCRMMEIDPVYADVILRRWSAFTRQQPILGQSGTPFLQAERERLYLEKGPSEGVTDGPEVVEIRNGSSSAAPKPGGLNRVPKPVKGRAKC